jgi:hypothetical protein
VSPKTSIRAGGVALIAGAISFMAVFSFLAARFDYPAILDGPANTVLPRLLATTQLGATMIEPEHILLGLIREPKGLVAQVFERSGVSTAEIRSEIANRHEFRNASPSHPSARLREVF